MATALVCKPIVVFDEWHEVDVIVALDDDEDPLAAITLLVRVFKDVQHVSLSDEEHDSMANWLAGAPLEVERRRIVCRAEGRTRFSMCRR